MNGLHAVQYRIDRLSVRERIMYEADVALRGGRVQLEVGDWFDVWVGIKRIERGRRYSMEGKRERVR